MPTRDEKLDELIWHWNGAWFPHDRTERMNAIHAHVEARVAAAYEAGVAMVLKPESVENALKAIHDDGYKLGFEAGRASQVLRVEALKPEPTQFIIAGGDSLPKRLTTSAYPGTGESHD